MSSELPKYTLLDADVNREMLKLFKGVKTGWLQVGEKKWCFPRVYLEHREALFKFKARPSDIWILSHPRSGTTWTQELVWLLCNDLDFETAKKIEINRRFPWLENIIYKDSETMEKLQQENRKDPDRENSHNFINTPAYRILDNDLSNKRFIKSHLSLTLMPDVLKSGCKIIYIARNPKDVVVSWYFLCKSLIHIEYVGDFPTFWNYFKNNLTLFGPYWEHVKEGWALRKRSNVLFIFYEELKTDLLSSIKKISKFLGKSYDHTRLPELINHLDIKCFKKNPMMNLKELEDCGIFKYQGHFMREGKIGNWQSLFDPELDREADEWIAQNLKDTDIVFPMVNLIGSKD